MSKFKTVCEEIQRKQRQYAEVMQKRSVDLENQGLSGNYQLQKQQLISDDTLKLQNEVDFHAEQINQRQDMFNQAEVLMKDINAIANQIQTQTRDQGEELVRTDQTMDKVVENADDAHKEILQAREYQKSTSKWLVWAIIVGLVIIVIIVLSLTLKK